MTLTEETGVVPPVPHAWMVPLVEDMLHYARTGLTEAIVMDLGRAILFYGRQSLGEGLSLVRLGMQHSYSQEQALWLANQPILPLTP